MASKRSAITDISLNKRLSIRCRGSASKRKAAMTIICSYSKIRRACGSLSGPASARQFVQGEINDQNTDQEQRALSACGKAPAAGCRLQLPLLGGGPHHLCKARPRGAHYRPRRQCLRRLSAG